MKCSPGSICPRACIVANRAEVPVPQALRSMRPGDTITGSVEVISVRTDKPITELRTTVTRDDGTVVLVGTAVCYTMDIGTRTKQ